MSIKSNFWVIVFVVILFSLFVWPQATARANLPIIEVSGNITTDTTWTSSNIYVITGHLTIDEHITLTIHQGTIIKFDGNKLMAVNGKLIVQGTPSNPVYITSLKDDTLGGDTNGDGVASSPQPGDWGHINFRDPSTDAENLIENTVIQYGGYFNAYRYEYYDCYNCAYHGVLRFEGSSPTIRNNTLQNNVGYALTGDVNSYPVVSNNTILENGGNGLEIRGGTFSNDLPVVRYWHNTDIVYAITGHITIPTGITLVVDPGVIIKVSSNKLIGVNGVLKLGVPITTQASAAFENDLLFIPDAAFHIYLPLVFTLPRPVYITSLKDDTLGGDTNGDGVASSPQPGDWGHINFRDSSTDAENLIENTVIQYGGYFNAYHNEYYDCYNCAYHGVLRFEGSSPTIRGNQVRYNNYGLFTTNGALPLVTNNAIYKNEYYGFYNEDSGVVVKAENNWWGAVSGPYHSSNPGGTGNQVSNNVDFKPWLSASPVQ